MLDVEAIRAAPDALMFLNLVATDHALEIVVLDVFNDLLALGNFRRRQRLLLFRCAWRRWLLLRVVLHLCSAVSMIGIISPIPILPLRVP